MQTKLKQYIENYNKVISLDDFNENKSLNKEELLASLTENANIKHSLAEENNAIIQSVLVPLEHRRKLDSLERREIEDFISKLQTGFESLDTGMLYRLYKILLQDAKENNDVNRIVKYIYYSSFYEFLLQSTHPRKYRTSSFDEVLNYLDVYDTLTEEGKNFFLRSYGNQMLCKEYSYPEFKAILDFFIEKKSKDPNPNIPYDTYILAIQKNISNGLEVIRRYEEQGLEVPGELLNGVYEASCYIYENLNTSSKTSLPVKQVYEYAYHASRFHKGIITIDEYLNCLDKLIYTEEAQTLQEKSSSLIKMNSLYIWYYIMYKDKNVENLAEVFKKRVAEVLEFVKVVKASEYTRNMNSDLLSFMQIISRFYPYEKLVPLLLQSTTKRHTPTSIHSQSVAELCKILTRHMLRKNPEYFKGIVDDYSVEYIVSHQKEIIDLSHRMGMIHDIGKYYCIPIISINFRKLEDIEFESIKFHPYLGYSLVKENFPQVLGDAILYHHVWHNNKGGYPTDLKHTNNLPLIDILSMSDTIDAAIDFLGRSYVSTKTLADLRREFSSMKGTRYSKEAVELLDDPQIFEEVNYFLKNTRQNISYKAYTENQK